MYRYIQIQSTKLDSSYAFLCSVEGNYFRKANIELRLKDGITIHDDYLFSLLDDVFKNKKLEKHRIFKPIPEEFKNKLIEYFL